MGFATNVLASMEAMRAGAVGGSFLFAAIRRLVRSAMDANGQSAVYQQTERKYHV